MKLNYKFYSIESGSRNSSDPVKNIIILHGLFGSSKNWVTVSKQLANDFNVYSIDLRNHGDSPHSSDHSIPLMAQDLEEFIKDHKLENVWLLGHSMGGLVAMYFDLTHPHFLKSIMIQDISPRTYPFVYENEIKAMSIDLERAKSRSEIDDLMKNHVPDLFIRQFLQMNLERNSEGGYYWKLNVKALGDSKNLFTNLFETLKPSLTPALFILGGSSEYILKTDIDQIQRFYHAPKIQTIPNGGHYIHYTHAPEFMKIISDFIN